MGYRKLSHFTTKEILDLENLAFDKYGVSLDQMMQQAGQSIHDFVVMEIPEAHRILVLAGKGNNGGDALVAGDMLTQSERTVTSFRVNSPIPEKVALTWYDLIIDGLFGFSLTGNPRPPLDKIIEQINCSGVPVLSVDVPSGMEVSTGKIMHPTIKATYTLALGMPKKGLDKHPGYVGKVYLGNLGIPPEAYREKGIEAPNFSERSYLSLF